MTTGEIVYRIHNLNLDLMIPLTNVKTKSDKEMGNNSGYCIGYTVSEWQTAYPYIAPEYIFYPQNEFSTVVYYDEQRYIFIELPIYGTKIVYPGSKGEFQESLSRQIKSLELLYESKSFHHLLFKVKNSVRIELLCKIVERENPSPELYKTFIKNYQSSDFGFFHFNSSIVKKAFTGKSEDQWQRTRRLIEKLNDPVTIYRGGGSKSTPYRYSYSWTLDYNTAQFFAARFISNSPYIIRATIKKKHILEYIDSNAEHEILVAPQYIENVHRTNLLTLEKVIPLKFTGLYNQFSKLIESIPFSCEDEHGKDHTARVLYLALIIAEKQNLNPKDVHTLCMAIAYHDSGRSEDGVNESHGAEGYRTYLSKHMPNEVISFLMTYHCIEDFLARKVWEKKDFQNKEMVWKLYEILKDADALDRVRFGLRELDTDYLRDDYSKLLVPVANSLQKMDMFDC